MKNPRLTQPRYAGLHPAEQLKAYCTHSNNLVFHRNRPDGLSRVAQANLHNNWQDALFQFGNTLPPR